MARLLYAQSIAFLVLYVVFSSALAAAPPGRARISDAEQQQQPVGARAAPPHGVSALIKPAAPIWPERFSVSRGHLVWAARDASGPNLHGACPEQRGRAPLELRA